MTKEVGRYIEPFPYKKEFLDPDRLWNNFTKKNYGDIAVININKKYPKLAGIVERTFKSKSIAIILKLGTYNDVTVLTDYFSEKARMMANVKGYLSPYIFYMKNYDWLLEEAKKIENGLPLKHNLREILYSKAIECNTCKPVAMKILMQYLGSKTILDPSAGWGDRLLAAAAAGVKVYHGIDPNTLMRKPYKKMISFISKKGINEQNGYDYRVFTNDFLKIDLESKKYDTIFTSPPFFDHENYSEDENQSVSMFSSEETWINDFYYPYLEKAYFHLIKGGYFVLYITDTKHIKFVKRTYEYMENTLKAKRMGVINIANTNMKYLIPISIWEKI